MTHHKWRRELKRLAKEYRGRLRRTGKGHFKIILPNGSTVYAASSPSDERAIRNARAELRRAATKEDLP